MATTQINPYAKPNSAIAKIFDMAVDGTTRVKIVKACETAEIGSARVFRELKLEDFRGMKWSYSEDENGNIKVTVASAKKAKVAPKAEKAVKAAKVVAAEVVEDKPVKKVTAPTRKPSEATHKSKTGSSKDAIQVAELKQLAEQLHKEKLAKKAAVKKVPTEPEVSE